MQLELGQGSFSKYWGLEALSGEGNGTPLQYSCLKNPWSDDTTLKAESEEELKSLLMKVK